MRRPSAITFLTVATLLAGASSVAAQEYEDYEHPYFDFPLQGYVRDDGVLVLRDEDFCTFLQGSIYGSGKNIADICAR